MPTRLGNGGNRFCLVYIFVAFLVLYLHYWYDMCCYSIILLMKRYLFKQKKKSKLPALLYRGLHFSR